ncbi:MAG: pilus assembly protein PilM [Planctomycetota bacterium]
MFEFLKKRVFPTGVDLGSRYLKMAQLGFDGRQLYLNAAGREQRPDDIEPGSAQWQRWVAGAAKDIIRKGGFSGKQVITSIPADDVFIEQIKIPKSADKNVEHAVLSKIEKKLPFNSKNAMVKYVVSERHNSNGQMDVLVMAAERQTVDRHLAIYEKAHLEISGISIWPLAMTNSYVELFGRRAEDRETVVMLVDIGANHTNIVVSMHSNLLFARMIPTGSRQLEKGDTPEKLMDEINACFRYFELVSDGAQIQRLVLISGRGTENSLCEKIAEFAREIQVPAQIGDVLAAVQVKPGCKFDIERRGPQADWATAFGLSLSVMQDKT